MVTLFWGEPNKTNFVTQHRQCFLKVLYFTDANSPPLFRLEAETGEGGLRFLLYANVGG